MMKLRTVEVPEAVQGQDKAEEWKPSDVDDQPEDELKLPLEQELLTEC
jgi:hypothetical protein